MGIIQHPDVKERIEMVSDKARKRIEIIVAKQNPLYESFSILDIHHDNFNGITYNTV